MPPDTRPALLLVHGAWHGAWYWEEKTAPWLRAQGFRVETLDLPGHGVAGAKRISWYSINDYVDAVEHKLEQIEGQVVVAGHSMGGFVVQKLMERRPARLVGAILVAAATPRGVFGVVTHLLRRHPLDLLIASACVNLYHLVRTPDLARELFYSAQLPDSAVRDYWSRIGNESFRAFLDMLGLAAPKPGLADATLPKLVIGGSADRIFPPHIVEGTARAYGVPATIFEDLAHSMNIDVGWQQVAHLMAEWVDNTHMPQAAA